MMRVVHKGFVIKTIKINIVGIWEIRTTVWYYTGEWGPDRNALLVIPEIIKAFMYCKKLSKPDIFQNLAPPEKCLSTLSLLKYIKP